MDRSVFGQTAVVMSLSRSPDFAGSKTAIPVLMGPTATGKTDLLSKLRLRDRIEVISCDSRQIYEGMPVGTAQPDARTLSEIPHHLVGFLPPSRSYSAGEFRRDVDRLVADIQSRGKIPLICGGTGFYFRAVRTRMIDIEEDADLRRRVEGFTHEERLHLLRQMDEDSLVVGGEVSRRGRVHPNDRYRVARALIVLMQTGRPLRSYYEEGFEAREDKTFQGVWLDMPDADWRERVHSRAVRMIEEGLVDEAMRIFRQFGHCPALRTPGYSEAVAFASGEIGRGELKDRLVRSHIQYGRRQRVWFRGETSLTCVSVQGEAIRLLEKVMEPSIRD